ncbi:DNA helicase [Lithospermum erythrorhizon]|uniref:ATP-dependent DNA helicase n=1 Tax=Lithospermum erythrorhizon TaxID=34254 RepID=A0AAV3RKU4_LITER
MADKYVIHALDTLLQDLCQNQQPFGGKLVVFGGDFRQVLPVVRGGGRTEQVEASIVTSPLWEHFIKIKLSINMRARSDPGFVDFLMGIGNGEEPMNSRNEIQIPKPMLIRYTTMEESIEQLIKYVYPNMHLFETNPFEMMQRVILCPKNEFVDDINSKLIKRIPGEEKEYISDDRAKSVIHQGDYIDYLNSLEPRGLPQHRLLLKKNSPVILLRNINPVEGLCNGTRLICKHLTPNVVGVVIATGQYKGKLVWIPRIPLEPNTSDIFTHGQLYVALSRAKTGDKVKLLIVPPTCNDPGTEYTTNVVYNEVLVKASCI